MPSGKITVMNTGVLKDITTNAPMTVRRQSRNVKKVLGNSPSMVLISSENRFTMRPVGVVSKKDMGDLTTLWSIFWCIVFEAAMVRSTNINCIDTIRTAVTDLKQEMFKMLMLTHPVFIPHILYRSVTFWS